VGNARIVTDSTAELPSEVARQLGIVVVPLTIRVGSKALVDETRLQSVEFHGRMAKNGVVATAVAPTRAQFADAYSQLSEESSCIVSIHISSRLNNTVKIAKDGSVGFLGRCRVSVIDSRVVSRALGILVTEAAKAARDGASGQEIVRLVLGMIPRTYFAFYVQDPDHFPRKGLLRPGRGSGLATVGSPLLTMEDGEIRPVYRLRGRGTALEQLLEFVAEFRGLRKLSIVHSGLMPEVGEFRERLADLLPDGIVGEHIYGPALGTYIGPAALGIVAFEGQAGGGF